MAGELEEIKSKLEQISDELADLAIHRLHQSIDAGGKERPLDEKRFTQARRAVEKAISVLRLANDESEDVNS